MLHLSYHFLVPFIIALLFFRKQWKISFLIMMLTMIVDIDHIIANPIYDPQRCSIGFHPLHMLLPIAAYVVLCFIPKTKFIGIGLVIHMALDSIDCKMNVGEWIHVIQ